MYYVFKPYNYTIYENVEIFFRWITWQTWTEQDIREQEKALIKPLEEFDAITKTLIKKIDERTYPHGTKKLKKKETLTMLSEANNRKPVYDGPTRILKNYVVQNPWADDSDNPHDPEHKENYTNAKETVKKNLNNFLTEINNIKKFIDEKAKILINQQKVKIPTIKIKIDEAKRSYIEKLNQKLIELKMELDQWNEVGGEPKVYNFFN